MGSSLSWLGVQARSATQVLAALKLSNTGQAVGFGQCEIAATILPGGWFVIVCNQFWHPLIHPAAMQQASTGRDVFGYAEYEAVNTALAFQYRNSTQLWQLSHQLDEGRDHLAIQGDAPPDTGVLLATAMQDGAREGHDAVFGVPGAVLRQVSGINLAAAVGAVYYRLVADPAAALPQTEDEMATLLTGAMAHAFAPVGFTRVAVDPRGDAWDSLLRQNVVGTQYIRPFVWEREDHYVCDAWLEIRDTRVVQVLEKFTPSEAVMPTATLRFSDFVSESDCVVDSLHKMETFVKEVERQFADLLPKTADMVCLDTLVNGDSEEIDFMKMLASFAPLVIAYLGRNPHFENMVARADQRMTPDPDDPVSVVMHIATYLRTHLSPNPSFKRDA